MLRLTLIDISSRVCKFVDSIFEVAGGRGGAFHAVPAPLHGVCHSYRVQSLLLNDIESSRHRYQLGSERQPEITSNIELFYCRGFVNSLTWKPQFSGQTFIQICTHPSDDVTLRETIESATHCALLSETDSFNTRVEVL